MFSIKKALIYGFLTWLIPFIIAIPFYSKEGVPLIDIFFLKTIMVVVGSITGAYLLVVYLKKVISNYIKESLILGLSWLVINWVLDFLVLVPMTKISVYDYFTQIGLRYLTILIVSVSMGTLLHHKNERT